MRRNITIMIVILSKRSYIQIIYNFSLNDGYFYTMNHLTFRLGFICLLRKNLSLFFFLNFKSAFRRQYVNAFLTFKYVHIVRSKIILFAKDVNAEFYNRLEKSYFTSQKKT